MRGLLHFDLFCLLSGKEKESSLKLLFWQSCQLFHSWYSMLIQNHCLLDLSDATTPTPPHQRRHTNATTLTPPRHHANVTMRTLPRERNRATSPREHHHASVITPNYNSLRHAARVILLAPFCSRHSAHAALLAPFCSRLSACVILTASF